ncbi:hypothetical protein QM716_28350 [Rhodococcus sp. IEGM 1409]|uniref:hypothetical protein n=1 Tax=Rhodococcus sp. IEGM 1409 TaxID=3047082 RepID=UPI0024B711A6|nr:hypothetical protein [Rhodococcus sp. IEGM 1409]MDI9903781.1 hypothetical protein [Rhodococcus sp. IEGM 1409]
MTTETTPDAAPNNSCDKSCEQQGGRILNGLIDTAESWILTAEQVEDVQAAREALRGYRNFDGYARSHVNRLIKAVDALFPATEPADEVKFDLPEGRPWDKKCTTDGDCGAAHHLDFCYNAPTPAPAESAEEETKADRPRKFRKKPVEVEAIRLDNHTTPERVARWCGGRVATPTVGTGCPIVIEIDTLEGVMTAHPGDWIIKGTQGEFYPCKPAPFADTFEPASLPVVPAPTETGPWPSAADVPDGVKFVSKGREGGHSIWLRCGKGSTEYADLNNPMPLTVKGYQIWDVSAVNDLAPFVAAEEGTKAEAPCTGGGDMHPCVLPARHAGVHTDSRGLRWNNPASSPVVPVPTQTGAWPRLNAVPENVEFRGTFGDGGHTETVWIKRDGVIWHSRPGKSVKETYRIGHLAPFVPAKGDDA